MSSRRLQLELNEPTAHPRSADLRQHLISASNEIYLHSLLCEELGVVFPDALARAHSAIRAELRRLETPRDRGDAPQGSGG